MIQAHISKAIENDLHEAVGAKHFPFKIGLGAGIGIKTEGFQIHFDFISE